jgi:hypothetical protein
VVVADFMMVHRSWIPEFTFAIEAAQSAGLAFFASSALFALLLIVTCAAFLSWMRRAAT